MSADVVWTPSEERINSSNICQFLQYLREQQQLDLSNYSELHQWSVKDPEKFWSLSEKFLKLIWSQPYQQVRQLSETKLMMDERWFPDGQLNFAENLLMGMSDEQKVVSIAEGLAESKVLYKREIIEHVKALRHFMMQQGVQPGDRVAGFVSNSYHALMGMLAASSLGAIWTSCSPDFGVEAVFERFSQVEPKVLIAVENYVYNGKLIDSRQKVELLKNKLPSLEAVIFYHLSDDSAEAKPRPSFYGYDEIISNCPEEILNQELAFAAMKFNDPLYILYSSGTTGVPKCIVHSIGGTLLQHKKELILHTDLKPGQTLFYFTTCGWMMWNWMASALSCGVNLLVYDGSISQPDLHVLWKIVDEHAVDCFGTSPKFLQLCAKADLIPRDHYELKSLKSILSTGAPLLAEQFDWVYDNVKTDLHLASISGGTDIVSCFMLGVPTLPVVRGEIQNKGLGMDVDCVDEQTNSIRGERGELVCRQSFPSMPVGFWGDESREKYKDAYFNHFENMDIWRHGDFIEMTESGGILVHGRSDATLNPSGVRIGTAEIYRQVETLAEIQDSVVIDSQLGSETQIILFVVLSDKTEFTSELARQIKQVLKENLSPRHVPQQIFPISEVPYTRSGKKLEIAVKQAFAGQKIANLSAVANPEALNSIRKLGNQ